MKKGIKCQFDKKCKSKATCEINDKKLCPSCFERSLMTTLIAFNKGERDYQNTFRTREDKRMKLFKDGIGILLTKKKQPVRK